MEYQQRKTIGINQHANKLPHGLQLVREWDLVIKACSYHLVPCTLDMELPKSLFSLLGFGTVLSWYFLIPYLKQYFIKCLIVLFGF